MLTITSVLGSLIPVSALAQAPAVSPALPTSVDSSPTPSNPYQWGVLAMNADKEIYQAGEQALLSFGVLDENGDMVCDAKLTLQVTSGSFVKKLSTDTGEITVNPECYIKDFTKRPDFQAALTLPQAGKYDLKLQAATKNGTSTMYSQVYAIDSSLPFWLTRQGPTRVYPKAYYPMALTVTVSQDFDGLIQDRVPASFAIDENKLPSGSYLIKEEFFTTIVFPLTLAAGQTVKLTYWFLPPPVSPEFFQLGPLTLRSTKQVLRLQGEVLYRESRLWQIANDAVTNQDGYIFITAGTTSWPVPSDWNNNNNSIEVIGAGGTGGTGPSKTQGAGGGGGAYSKSTNVTLPAGSSVTVAVGAAGGGSGGGDTYLCNSASNCASIAGTAVVVGAKGGANASGATLGGGGATSTGVSNVSIKYKGGDGAAGGGGGGAAGPNGNGGNGSTSTGGNGDNNFGGTGGSGGTSAQPGGNGTEWSSTPSTFGSGGGGGAKTGGGGATTGLGGLYGGGGGGTYGGTGAAAKAGLIVIRYTPPTRISGTAYASEGGAALASKTINVLVNGTATTSTSTAANGTWYVDFSSTMSQGDVVTAYIAGDAVNGMTVDRASGTALTNLDIYGDSLIVRSDDASAVTNANLATADNNIPSSDLVYSMSGNDLTLNSNTELHVWTGDTYAPGATVNTQGTGNLHAATSSTATMATTTIAGDLVVNGSATANLNASTTISGGDITTTSNGVVTYSAGTPTLTMQGAGTLGGSAAITFYNLVLNGSSGTTTLATTTVINNNLTINANRELSSAYDVTVKGGTVSGNGFVNSTSGTFEVQGTGNFGGSTAWNFYNLTFGSGTAASTTMAGTATITVSNLLSIGSTSKLAAASASGLSVSGSWTNSGTFYPNSGTVTFTATTTGKTITGGTGGFHNIVFNGSGGEWTLQDSSLTVTGNVTMTAGTLLGSTDLTIQGGSVTGNGTIIMSGGSASSNLFNVTKVAGGASHTCALTKAGNLYCWGNDTNGQLGNGASVTANQTSPTRVVKGEAAAVDTSDNTNLTGVVKVVAAGNHACAVTITGNVYCWGSDTYGQLGNGATTGDQVSPVRVPKGAAAAIDTSDNTNLTGVAEIAAGSRQTCAATAAGNLYCWGYDLYGQQGNGNGGDQTSPGRVVKGAAAAIDTSDNTNLTGVVSVASGNNHVCAATAAGNLYCWGDDTNGEIGNGATTGDQVSPVRVLKGAAAAVDTSDNTNLTGVVSVVGGNVTTCAITATGNLYCWGRDTNGEVGDGSGTDAKTAPVRVVKGEAAAIDTSDNTNLTGVKTVAAGARHVCAVTVAGNLYCWGEDVNGQIGDGSGSGDKTAPVRVVKGAAAAIDTSDNTNLTSVVSIGLGDYHTCAIMASGNFYCWGKDDSGQAGDGSGSSGTSPVSVLKGEAVETASDASGLNLYNIKQVSGGNYQTCAVTAQGNLYCWGYGFNGQLGDNDTTVHNAGTPVRVLKGAAATGDIDSSNTYLANVSSIAAGDSFTCAVTAQGNLYCWGDGFYGRLGDNNTASHSTGLPVRVLKGAAATGDIDSSNTYLANVSNVEAGYYYACAVTIQGNLYCWGYSQYGKLGDNDTTTHNAGLPVRVFKGAADGVAGDVDSSNTYLANVSTVKAGDNHTCASTIQGNAYCWGYGNFGQLGDNDTTAHNAGLPVRVLKGAAAAGDIDSSNTYLANVSNVEAGYLQVCALTIQGNTYCWGYGFYGQLGDNVSGAHNVGLPVRVLKGAADGVAGDVDSSNTYLANVSGIATGDSHTCAVTAQSNLYCWGYDQYGRLGDNNTTDHNVAIPVRTLKGAAYAPQGATTFTLSGTGNFGGNTAWTFSNLTFGSGSAATTTIQGTGAVTVSGTLTVAASQVLDAGLKTYNLTGGGTPMSVSGTFTASSSLIAYVSTSSDQSILAATYYNLQIGTSTSAKTYTLPTATTTITGNLVISSGTLDAASSTLAFIGTGTSTITSVASTTFYNLYSTAAGKILQFQAATGNPLAPVFTIAGTLTLTGAQNNLIKLQSDTTSTQWLANFNSAQNNITYVNLLDCGCSDGSADANLDATSQNGGRNGSCWKFPGQGGGGGSVSYGGGSTAPIETVGGQGDLQTGGSQDGGTDTVVDGGSGGGEQQTGGDQSGGGGGAID